MDWTIIVDTISTVIISAATVSLCYINKKQSDIQKKQNEIWHKTNYPDIVITDFSLLNNENPEMLLSIYNKSDFSLMLKSIFSENSKFKCNKSESRYEAYRDVNINIYSKGTFELHTSASTPDSPSQKSEVPIDRKTQNIYFERSQTTITLKLKFFMPILDTNIIADLNIYEMAGRFNYSVKYRES